MYHVNAADLPGNEVSRTFEGGRHGPCSVSFFLVHNQPGQGPRLHHHPYDETFVILEGRSKSPSGRSRSRAARARSSLARPGRRMGSPTSDLVLPGSCASMQHPR